ncbi:hypothetical protein JCM10212_004971 [Sporobolomyces blumeae]
MTSKGKGKAVETIEVDSDGDGVGFGSDEREWDVTVAATEEEQEQLQKMEVELADIDEQVAKLRSLQAIVRHERNLLLATIESRKEQTSNLAKTNGKSTARTSQPSSAVDYEKTSFTWSEEAKALAQDIWKIFDWRYCQEAAINASMDNRDVVCVMPTGGGKSLIYQVPALLSPGTTVVITPLISLMSDQVHNLHARDIAAEAIHASTTQQESRDIMKRMLGPAGAPKKGKKKAMDDEEAGGDHDEIKLVYVTPERIDKSKTFMSTLQKMYDAGLLARFVIDEAHCITMTGHDYRPAYLSLERLKVVFPKVPILAVTATAPSNVISDMIKTLGLPRRTSPGNAALPNSTVLFSAPLYRPNLNWSVVPKPSKPEVAVEAIIDWILDNHEGETGIVYCLSRADSENVAKAINASKRCKGKLRAAVYHAYIEDAEKVQVHDLWREKKVQVVCATNASFGLGIDHPNVRFVVHHTLAKSLANLYQEGGRAGRDGLESDCITYFRAADASRISTLIYTTWRNGGREKLYEMLKFAQDFTTCRKILFARYFASTYDDSGAFALDEGEDPCGTCDNCSRDKETVAELDISHDAYRALRIIRAAVDQRGTLTLPQAADLVRGNGGGAFSIQDKNSKGKGYVKVQEVAGGKVALSKDETETMLLKLLVDGWLDEVFNVTAYAVNSYLRPSSTKSLRLTRLAPAEVEKRGLPVTLTMDVLSTKGAKGRKRAAPRTSTTDASSKKAKTATATSSKRGGRRLVTEDEDEGDDEDDVAALWSAQDDQLDTPSSEPAVDDDGWTRIVQNSNAKRGAEVIELD